MEKKWIKWDFILYRLNVTQLITLLLDSQKIPVLCHMGDFGCGDGGWTPVMKMDGNKVDFSVVWLKVRERKWKKKWLSNTADLIL